MPMPNTRGLSIHNDMPGINNNVWEQHVEALANNHISQHVSYNKRRQHTSVLRVNTRRNECAQRATHTHSCDLRRPQVDLK